MRRLDVGVSMTRMTVSHFCLFVSQEALVQPASSSLEMTNWIVLPPLTNWIYHFKALLKAISRPRRFPGGSDLYLEKTNSPQPFCSPRLYLISQGQAQPHPVMLKPFGDKWSEPAANRLQSYMGRKDTPQPCGTESQHVMLNQHLK